MVDKMKQSIPKDYFDSEYPPMPENSSFKTRFAIKFHRLIQVNPKHPNAMEYFKSDVAIFNEKQRHYEQYKYTIHPLSKFNQFYEVWSFLFYGLLLFYKSFDFAFIRISTRYPFEKYVPGLIFGVVLDCIALVNIIFQFFIGYCIHNTGHVELSKTKISLYYLANGHFFCDLLSSIPRVISYRSDKHVFIISLLLTLLKLRRITTFIKLMKPTATYCGIKSDTKIFILGFFLVVTLIMHVMTCLHVGIPRIRLAVAFQVANSSYLSLYMLSLPLYQQYLITFFKSAQYTFLIDVPYLTEHYLPEELIFCLVNYTVGKLLIAVIWIVLLYTFMTQRMLRTKFEEVMTELNDYMVAKQLPADLRTRLVSYYTYKYKRVFFNEVFIRSVLSENLKQEIDLYLCKSLIKQVSIFSQIPARIVKQIVSHLIPEIYLPNDLIIQSGIFGDCMYFIESGTVAVFTPSGREICHLNDGAYFGEISILIKDQKRTASIIAIETTRIFKLRKEDFDNCFNKHEEVYSTILEMARKRMEETKKIEVEFKQFLFEQAFN
ncbi:hypothetical protein ABEB36_013167 [Hypothenemus hampei]|uniref:Cyclic nucleotide-binding domain-containing protein n=1 Tax=Hypothenemus hampei TaxID=57062 RepID=A0ABD1E7W0_HYPHA